MLCVLITNELRLSEFASGFVNNRLHGLAVSLDG